MLGLYQVILIITVFHLHTRQIFIVSGVFFPFTGMRWPSGY